MPFQETCFLVRTQRGQSPSRFHIVRQRVALGVALRLNVERPRHYPLAQQELPCGWWRHARRGDIYEDSISQHNIVPNSPEMCQRARRGSAENLRRIESRENLLNPAASPMNVPARKYTGVPGVNGGIIPSHKSQRRFSLSRNHGRTCVIHQSPFHTSAFYYLGSSLHSTAPTQHGSSSDAWTHSTRRPSFAPSAATTATSYAP